MAKPREGTTDAGPFASAGGRRNKFIGSDHDLEQFGLTTDDEYVKAGFVSTDKVRAMLDEFGLQDRKEIEFPFQHLRHRGYESWSLRIEPVQTHQVKGELVHGHAWVYKRERPELVANQQ